VSQLTQGHSQMSERYTVTVLTNNGDAWAFTYGSIEDALEAAHNAMDSGKTITDVIVFHATTRGVHRLVKRYRRNV
jgi:hypothetical protein